MKNFSLNTILTTPLLYLGISYLFVGLLFGKKVEPRWPIKISGHCSEIVEKNFLMAYAYSFDQKELSDKYLRLALKLSASGSCEHFIKYFNPNAASNKYVPQARPNDKFR